MMENTMFDFYDCVLLKHGLAWAVGAGIFLFTVLLVSRRIIGFYTSLFLMLIALGASMTIEHREEATAYWNKYVPEVFHIIEDKTSDAIKSVKDSAGKPKEAAPVVTPMPGPVAPPAPITPQPDTITPPNQPEAEKPVQHKDIFAEPASETSKIQFS
jgi:hypothetical protein